MARIAGIDLPKIKEEKLALLTFTELAVLLPVHFKKQVST
jgi:hypothetical protein